MGKNLPQFIDLFLEELDKKAQKIINVIEDSPERLNLYRELLRDKWHPLPAEAQLNKTIYAVDSSDGGIELRGGATIHITRSIAVSNTNDEKRCLRVNVFYAKNQRDYVDYRRLAREHVEHQAALKALENMDQGDLLLIDGSLYGRMLHVFRPLKIHGLEHFLAEYVDTYHKLLAEALEKNVTLVGVSKDSKSTLLKEALLHEKLLETPVNSQLKTKLEELYSDLARNPRKTLEKIARMRQLNILPEEIYQIFLEASNPEPDVKILGNLQLSPGCSSPLILSLKKEHSGQLEVFLQRDKEKIKERLRISFSEILSDEDTLEKLAQSVSKIAEYPPIIMLYAIFREKDIPLRVDIAAPGISAAETTFLKNAPPVVRDVLATLRALYAGLKHYNVLLEAADDKVKMRRKNVEYYKQIIERKLNKILEQTRGARRVSFP